MKIAVLGCRVGKNPSFPASCSSFISEGRSPGHTVFPKQEQGSAGMPLQIAGQDARSSWTAGLGVLDQSSGSLVSLLSLLPLFRLMTCALRCTIGHQRYVQISEWAADVDGLTHPPASSRFSQLAMDVMLSHPDLSTPVLSSSQSALTWHRMGGVWVHAFEDHYTSYAFRLHVLPGLEAC